jgi:uncharacterized protein (UPF0332 family)
VLNWPDHFALALELLEREGEVYQRTAVSKAYYAMFYNARGRLKAWWEWAPDGDESDHEYCWNAFCEKHDDGSKQIGEDGHRLRKLRNEVDYAEEVRGLSEKVDLGMIRAKRLRDILAELK